MGNVNFYAKRLVWGNLLQVIPEFFGIFRIKTKTMISQKDEDL